MSFVKTAAGKGIIPEAHSSVAHSHLIGFKNMGKVVSFSIKSKVLLSNPSDRKQATSGKWLI